MKQYYVVVWQECYGCGEYLNDNDPVRIELDVAERAGNYKYMYMLCPNCNKIAEFKRGCWWNLVKLTDIIETYNGVKCTIESLPDYTERVRSRDGRRLDDYSVHGG